MRKLLSTVAVIALFAPAVASANPLAAAAASEALSGSVAGASANATGVGTGIASAKGGKGTGIGVGGGGEANSSGSITNKSGDSRALGIALGQAATAAAGCEKGNKFAFGLLEWTDHSSKCALYEAAAIAEAAAAQAPDQETANFYYIRANELMLKAEGN